MKRQITVVLLVVTMLLVAVGVSNSQAGNEPPVPSQSDPTGAGIAPAGVYDFTNHGTDWVAENRGAFSLFNPVGWGTQTRSTAAGQRWVHIPIPYPSRIANTMMRISYVEFCAQSSNGVGTRPIRMDLWDYVSMFSSAPVAWPADNARHCVGRALNPPVWKQDLGVSVLINYANNADTITLYKAWVRVIP